MSKAPAVEIEVALETLTCANCYIVFGLPPQFLQHRRRDHRSFYCPVGHTNYFLGESDLEKLQRELASANGNVKYYREKVGKLEKSRSALRGVATHLRNKALVGECAFCGRHFNDLALHIQEAHPDEKPEEISEKGDTE